MRHASDYASQKEAPVASTNTHPFQDADAFRAYSAFIEEAEVATKIGTWYWDNVNNKIHWSAGLEAIYGLPRGGFGGTYEDFAHRVHPDDVQKYEQARDAAIAAGKPFDFEFRIVRPDGTVRWVATWGASKFDGNGNLSFAAGLNVDITERKAYQSKLELQSQIFENMAEGVMMVSAETLRIVYTNQRFEDLMGYAPGQLVGKPVAIINAPGEYQPEEVVHMILKELTAKGFWQGRVKNLRADGREIWSYAITTSFVHNQFGRVWLNVHNDITAQVLAEQERDRVHADLLRLSLKSQNAIEDELAALSRDIHDEIGSLLTGVRLRLEALAQVLPDDAGTSRDTILDIAHTVNKALVTTRQFCARLRPAVLDDLGLIETIRWYSQDWADQTGIHVEMHLDGLPHEPGKSLATCVFRVLQELLTNVARHSTASAVKVVCSQDYETLKLSVADNGKGYAPNRGSAGLGLLGITERLRQFGGTLHMPESTQGCIATISIPVEPRRT